MRTYAMGFIVKLVSLIYLTLVVTYAASVRENLVTIPMDDIDSVHDRETRSSGIPWYLDRIDQRKSDRPDGKYSTFANGTGVDIYVLADGIDYDDKEFGKRAFDVELSHFKRRCNYLGTHIGHLAAGVYAGVAKNSNIIVPRVTIDLLTCHLKTTYKDVKMGIQWVIESVKKTGRRSVLVIPLVIGRLYFWNAIAEEAIKENIVVVTPAGDSLHDACRYSPGSSPDVINVGATNRGDTLYESNFGPCVSLYAPGIYKKGTVQACALVAGAAALVLEKYPHFTPAQVKQHLIDEATDVAIDVSKAKRLPPDAIKGKNKLLFVGYDDGSGNYLDGITLDEDIN